ncbi:MAG: exo-alpha-sialidase [Gammaproteobacteria bacterium]|nr:exo-alpha-sialidase [Gammaproteobacteria bacterium]
MKRLFETVFCAGILGVAACLSGAQAAPPAHSVETVRFEATNAGMPWLAPLSDGGVVMSWTRLTPEGPRLEHARFADGRWSASEEIARAQAGEEWFVNWADFPSIVELDDGRFAAHYLVSSGPDVFAYDVHVATRTAEGAWQPSIVPHRDGTPTEHGFVSLLPWHEHALKAIWLDGRHTHAEQPGHGDPMALRSAVIDGDDLTHEHEIDASVCDCCQTSAVRLPGEGALVAYRGRSREEVRDILVARFRDGAWSTPRVVHDDGWVIHGCPVNGPAIAATGERIALAWFTLAHDEPRVNVAFSDDGGDTWSAPVRIDGGQPLGRVDVVMVDDDHALVSWIERDAGGPRIRVRSVAVSGDLGEPVTVNVDAGLASRASGFPRMARTGHGDVLIAWTVVNDDRRHIEVRRLHSAAGR